ncbi:META domain-containing protein [Rhodopseudomonas sp. BR0M22]|uniref:META domain-containing protein n=1 Tax=Rhodopseudomonas sp. BR0M22 TaxID=2269369 RepID=UPI0013DFB4B1|nr:META domain-containing protein [Rhodopseudomonas sp. BR0M22]NEW92483.1 META domain-containing protein [Rhodopseudomonas sp. BR0M22]
MRTLSLMRVAVLGAAILSAATSPAPAQSDQEFPFGLEVTLDAPPKPGSKRIPNLEIDDKGSVRLELWCKGGTGQFSVAGNTVIFVPGTIEDRNCPPDRAQADDALVAALAAATTWSRQGDVVNFAGPQPLRFRLNTN